MESKSLNQYVYIRVYGSLFDAIAFAESQHDESDVANGQADIQKPHTWCSPKRQVVACGGETVEEYAYQAMMFYKNKIISAWGLGAEFVVLQFVVELADANFLRGIHLPQELVELAALMRVDIDIDYIWQG